MADKPPSPHPDPALDPGDKPIIDRIAEEAIEGLQAPHGTVQSPVTETGLPVEDQVRKEWDPSKGGLPTFLR
ncbi:MAG: hypothetical protein JO038_09855 [Alphaproteobacteria bacterium]|nr:hypothetical protein [Alphaproteobacteria bacterium]